MTRWLGVWARRAALVGMSGWLFQAGCARAITQELEVLFAAVASPTQIYDSFLVNRFGPEILRLFAY